MLVALAALVMPSTGTAVPAVGFATNAGKVDGKDAVPSGAKLSQAAGDLVATNRSGPDRGRIPGRFLADVMRGGADSFARPAEVQDNAGDVPTALSSIPGLGTLTASCFDQNDRPGVEDPATTITFLNQPGAPVGVSRQVGEDRPEVGVQASDTASAFTIGGSNAFRLNVERAGVVYAIEGAVRLDGRGTATGVCAVWGWALRVGNTN